jgi:murein endopeptidase
MVRSRSSPLALLVAALAVALAALVALLAPGPGPAGAQGKTYIIKRGGSKWTKFGREHYHRKRHGGRKLRLVQLKGGDGYVVAKPDRAWGTRLAVYRISWVMALYRRRFPKADPVIILDLSRRGGGSMNNHMSHMDGRDVDIPLILNKISSITAGTKRTVDVEKTWFIVQQLVNSCDVEYIFVDTAVQKALHTHALGKGLSKETLRLILQWPDHQQSLSGVVRHWPNHKDHLHVRFRDERGSLPKAAKRYCDFLDGGTK